MKRFLIYIYLFLPVLTYGQLDRINSTPLVLNPSFSGSTGGTRIAANLEPTFYDYGNYYNSVASLDLFSQPLKGGIGFMAGYYRSNFTHHESINHGFQSLVAYAPKFTFRNKNLKKFTFSPSVALHYSRAEHGEFKQESFLVYNGLMLNRNNWFISAEIRLSRYGGVKLLGGYRFNKNPANAWSSTLIAQYIWSPAFSRSHYSKFSDYFFGFLSCLNYSVRYNNLVLSAGYDGVSLGWRAKNVHIRAGVQSITSNSSNLSFGTVILLNKKPGMENP